jgi:hypothetical protein
LLANVRCSSYLRATRQETELVVPAFELVERCVWLELSVGLAIVAAVCALRGYPWLVPAGTGFAAVGFRAISEGHCERRP